MRRNTQPTKFKNKSSRFNQKKFYALNVCSDFCPRSLKIWVSFAIKGFEIWFSGSLHRLVASSQSGRIAAARKNKVQRCFSSSKGHSCKARDNTLQNRFARSPRDQSRNLRMKSRSLGFWDFFLFCFGLGFFEEEERGGQWATRPL